RSWSSARSRRWCSTRPTRCWTWASCRTSRRSCAWSRTSVRPCSSRPPCPDRSSRWPGRSSPSRPTSGPSPPTPAAPTRTQRNSSIARTPYKPELVARVLQAEGRGATMIFCRTKRTAQKLADELADRGFRVGAIHGDLGQGAREKSLKAFRTSEVDVLVATDVAARGIDVDDVTHVINYQCPEDEKTYVHRIGRTGRAGRTGVAITLVDWDDIPRWGLIDKALGLGHGEPPET